MRGPAGAWERGHTMAEDVCTHSTMTAPGIREALVAVVVSAVRCDAMAEAFLALSRLSFGGWVDGVTNAGLAQRI